MTLSSSIPEGQLRFTYARSAGPGGQNVNKVNTRVTLWFDLAACTTLSEEQKRRVRTRLHGRINKDGRLHVVSYRHRTQLDNRRAATARFYELLAAALQRPKVRKPTRVPARARRRRLEEKRRRGERKALRSDRSIDRCDR